MNIHQKEKIFFSTHAITILSVTIFSLKAWTFVSLLLVYRIRCQLILKKVSSCYPPRLNVPEPRSCIKLCEDQIRSDLVAVIDALELDPDNYNISRSAIDGKWLSDPTGQATVDRFPVFISGVDTQQMLSVSKLNRNTGAEPNKVQIFRQSGSHRKQTKNANCFKKSRFIEKSNRDAIPQKMTTRDVDEFVTKSTQTFFDLFPFHYLLLSQKVHFDRVPQTRSLFK